MATCGDSIGGVCSRTKRVYTTSFLEPHKNLHFFGLKLRETPIFAKVFAPSQSKQGTSMILWCAEGAEMVLLPPNYQGVLISFGEVREKQKW